jgi:hypothetical protein
MANGGSIRQKCFLKAERENYANVVYGELDGEVGAAEGELLLVKPR